MLVLQVVTIKIKHETKQNIGSFQCIAISCHASFGCQRPRPPSWHHWSAIYRLLKRMLNGLCLPWRILQTWLQCIRLPGRLHMSIKCLSRGSWLLQTRWRLQWRIHVWGYWKMHIKMPENAMLPRYCLQTRRMCKARSVLRWWILKIEFGKSVWISKTIKLPCSRWGKRIKILCGYHKWK